MATCDVPDCDRSAASHGKCWAHLRQLQRTGRTKSLRERPVDARSRLFEGALALADADTEDDREYRSASRRFWAAADGWLLERLEELVRHLRAPGSRSRGAAADGHEATERLPGDLEKAERHG